MAHLLESEGQSTAIKDTNNESTIVCQVVALWQPHNSAEENKTETQAVAKAGREGPGT